MTLHGICFSVHKITDTIKVRQRCKSTVRTNAILCNVDFNSWSPHSMDYSSAASAGNRFLFRARINNILFYHWNEDSKSANRSFLFFKCIDRRVFSIPSCACVRSEGYDITLITREHLIFAFQSDSRWFLWLINSILFWYLFTLLFSVFSGTNWES